ncbi:hypothetical protein ACHAPO_011654 [Fusarium lateritium]
MPVEAHGGDIADNHLEAQVGFGADLETSQSNIHLWRLINRINWQFDVSLRLK